MTNSGDHRQASTSIFQWIFWGYILFVVYGSLVPLQYVGRPWSDAIQAFRNTPFLALGVESRADWVANGVLYLPVGFLTAGLLTRRFRNAPRALLFSMAFVFSVLLALAVEFTQLFFPQRTVSLNDIYAEGVGSLVGVVVSIRYARWFQDFIQSFYSDPRWLRARLLDVYVISYLSFAFFPYDFLLTGSELAAKVASDRWGWWVAGAFARPVHMAVQFFAESVLTLPFGFLLVRAKGGGLHHYRRAMFAGLVLGCLIELVQFFLYSGISQGVSVLSRALGVTGGVAMCQYAKPWPMDRAALALRRYTLPFVAIYLWGLLILNGWSSARWHGMQGVEAKLEQLHFMPFYYHYFTSEVKALFSVAAVVLSYLPVGVLVWSHRRSLLFSVVLALALATSVEAGKLFMDRAHPDPTNVLLACLASWGSASLLHHLFPGEGQSAPSLPAAPPMGAHHPYSGGAVIFLLLGGVGVGVWVAGFPSFSALVGLVLLGCTVVVWYRPVLVVFIIAAALPVFDLAPWSGRFFLDEFDALLLVGLGIAFVRVPKASHARMNSDFLFAATAALFALSYTIGAVRGMLPFQVPDVNAFNNYYSPYNALRIAKGAVWGFLVLGLFRRLDAAGMDVRRPLAAGMVLGLGATVAVILWERAAFSGLWNFSDGYRVTGPFSAMHTGGAYIECYLAVATPFLMLLILEGRSWILRLAGLSLLLLTTYALMVTFSRNGYVAFAVAVFCVLLVTVFNAKRFGRGGVIFGLLAGSMLLVAVPIFKGDFAQARMATVGADLGVRQAHWDDALSIRDTDWPTSLFGMGLGRYPEINFWRSAENHRSATYRLETAAGNTFLRLGSGNSIYVEQWVSLEPGRRYVLKLDVRPSVPDAKITVPMCEKWMLTSFNCVWQSIDLGKEFGVWRSIESRFDATGLSVSPWYSRRPIKLSLYYPTPNSTIDLDNVRLETESGTNLLRNGDFSNGLDHWFFTTDSHLPWHIKSLYYGVLFDQGWMGLLAVVALLFLALARAARNALNGDAVAGASFAALSSFMVVGVFDTLIDAPRFLLLLLLLVWTCIYSPHTTKSPA